jgi:alpha-tubulin suppressor-like RCC1 family protein
MNLNQIEFALSQKIAAGNDNLDLLTYTRAIQQLRTGAMFVVACSQLLPTASASNGKLYLVEDSQRVVFSNSVFWIPIVSQSSTGWTWGSNSDGQLGTSNVTNRSSPVREITSSCNWLQLRAGVATSMGLKQDSSLWLWGNNVCGQLGDNTVTSKSSPVREITSSTTWCQIGTSFYTMSGVKSDGSLWAWGKNTYGQVGDNTIVNKSSPVREISSSATWCQTSPGYSHTAALKTDGTLWGWGNNGTGQLGTCNLSNRSSPVREISSSTNWCQVSAGLYGTLALKTSGTLWGWGSNECGKFGNNSTSNVSSPVQEISSSTTWCQTSAGFAHSIALKTTNTLWAWGCNACGALGDNSTVSRSSPIQEATSATNWCQVTAGFGRSGALTTASTLWMWGNNNCGQLGNNSTTRSLLPIREISSSSSWSEVSIGQGLFTVARQTI